LYFQTQLLPHFLALSKKLQANQKTVLLNREAGLTDEKIKNAMRMYVYTLMSQHNSDSEFRHLCAKDPNILTHMAYLSLLFPSAKFVFMVRDPRAASFSLMKHYNEPLTERNKQKFLSDWNEANNNTYSQCLQVGSGRCLVIHYERLVMNSKGTMKRVAEFLGLSWSDAFLHHETLIGAKIKVSEVEWSTVQIKSKIYLDSMSAWANSTWFNLTDLSEHAAMFKIFGYDMNVTHHEYLKNGLD
jgi:protein-tyrosine sulfotransferase